MAKQFSVKGLLPQQAEVVYSVLTAALSAVDPRLAVSRSLSLQGHELSVSGKIINLQEFHRIRLVGVGKASVAMTQGALDILGSQVTDGFLIVKHQPPEGYVLPLQISVHQGGHPVPSQESITSTSALQAFLQDSSPTDLVLCLISGGGSALMTLLPENINLEDIQQLTRLLLACGADIGEINTLRKHLDRVKGGGLARMACPAKMVTLVLSDVIGSPLDVIASGPTVADSSTFSQAVQILRKYQIEESVPPAIISLLHRGQLGEVPETLKPGDPILINACVEVVGSNALAAVAGLNEAVKKGLNPLLLTTYLQGEASQSGVVLASLLKQVDATGDPIPRPACIAAGGETTVTLHGQGLGGRNQELALGSTFVLSGLENVALVTLGTDGEDGPTDAAGAVVTGDTIWRAKSQGLDPLAYLQNNDSYHFFRALGDLVTTGSTGTNVNDLVFLFAF